MISSKKATCLLYLIGSILTSQTQQLQMRSCCGPTYHAGFKRGFQPSAYSSSHVVVSHLHACTKATQLHLAMPQLPMLYLRTCTSEMKQDTHDTSPAVCLCRLTYMLVIAQHLSHVYNMSAPDTTCTNQLHYPNRIARNMHSAAKLDCWCRTAALTEVIQSILSTMVITALIQLLCQGQRLYKKPIQHQGKQKGQSI